MNVKKFEEETYATIVKKNGRVVMSSNGINLKGNEITLERKNYASYARRSGSWDTCVEGKAKNKI